MRLALVLVLLQDPAALVEKLRSGGVEEREEAAQALQELGAAAGPALEKAARDPDAEVAFRVKALLRRIRAAELLGADLAREVPRVVDRLEKEKAAALFADLVADLSRPEGERRYPGLRGPHLAPLARLAIPDCKDVDALNAALTACSRLNLRGVLPEILAVLRGPDDALRARAAHYLIDLRAKEALPEVAELLDDPRRDVRSSAIRILGRLRAASASARLEVCLKDADLEVRKAAAEALLSVNAWESAPAFRPLLQDPDVALRDIAIAAAGRWGDREAAPALVALAEKPESRRAALWALWDLGWTDPAPFVARLEDKDSDVRALAIFAAGQLGARDARPALRRALGNTTWLFADAALQAVVQLEDVEASPALLPLLKSPESMLRAEAARALGRFGHRAAVPGLIELLKDPDREVRRAAVDTLAQLEAREAVGGIRALLKDAEQPVRTSAAQALDLLAGEAAAPDLLPLLEDYYAANSVRDLLSRRLSAASVKDLWPLAESKSPDARGFAFQMLVRLGSLRVLERLETESFIMEREPMLDLLRAAEPKALLPLLRRGSPIDAWAAEIIRERGLRELIPAMAKEAFSGRGRIAYGWTLGEWKAVEFVPEACALLAKEFDFSALLYLSSLGDPAGIVSVRLHLKQDPERCAIALRRMGDPQLLPELRRMLQDPAQEKRADLLRGIGREGWRELMPEVERCLKEAELRSAALGALAYLGAVESIPAIQARLKDPEDHVRQAAVEALLELLPAGAPERIAELLPVDVIPGTRWQVLEAVAACGGPAQGPAVAALLKEGDKELALRVLRALVALSAREQAPAILPLLRHEDEVLARQAAFALAALGAPEAFAPLLQGLDAGRNDGREALARMPSELLLPALLERVSRDHDDVRESAAVLLGRCGGPAAERALRGLLSDEDDDVKGAAARSLGRLKVVAAAPQIRRLLRVRRIGVSSPHAAAVGALAALGDRASVPELRRFLQTSVGPEVVDALEILDAREAVPDLLKLQMTDGTSEAALRAARLLAAWGVEEAKPSIRSRLGSDRRMLQAAALLRDRESIPAILQRLEWGSGVLPGSHSRESLAAADLAWRTAAAEALAVLDREALKAALKHRHAIVRRAAAEALCRVGVREAADVLLKEDAGLFALNALRSPEAWAALAARPVAIDLPTRGSLLKAAGVAVEGEFPPSKRSESRRGSPATALDALRAALEGSGHEVILEAGRLRILKAAAAREFWAAWRKTSGEPR